MNMNERITRNFNKLAVTSSTLLAIAALDACSASSTEKDDAQIYPVCAVRITPTSTLEDIVADSGAYPDYQDGVKVIEQLNTGIIADKLSVGDDVALPQDMCFGLIDNKKEYHYIHMLDSPTPDTQE